MTGDRLKIKISGFCCLLIFGIGQALASDEELEKFGDAMTNAPIAVSTKLRFTFLPSLP